MLASRQSHTIRVGLGGNLVSNVGGFNQLAKLHGDLALLRSCDVTLDFSGLSGMDGHLAAALRTIFAHAARQGNAIRLTRMPERLRDTFRKNGLLKERQADTFGTTMPVTGFKPEDGLGFSVYAKRYLDRREMPRMTEPLRERFFEGIDELFANSSLHSRTQVPIVAAGQFYPQRRRLSFSIADGGRGIQGTVREVLKREMRADVAINWAMASGNTTRRGDVPGGLGSQVLREFIGLNGGRLVVVSNSGYWSQEGSEVRRRQLTHGFPGTIVVLDVDTTDRTSYELAGAPDPNAIW